MLPLLGDTQHLNIQLFVSVLLFQLVKGQVEVERKRIVRATVGYKQNLTQFGMRDYALLKEILNRHLRQFSLFIRLETGHGAAEVLFIPILSVFVVLFVPSGAVLNNNDHFEGLEF